MHTHASIAGSLHRVGSQQADGWTAVVPSLEPVLVVSVVSVVEEVVVDVDVVVVSVVSVVEPAVVVGTVGSPVLVPGFVEVDVEVLAAVASESDEPSDALRVSVDSATSSEQAKNSGEDATSARVSEVRLRKQGLLRAEDGGAAGPQDLSAQDRHLEQPIHEERPQFRISIRA
ncbi:hypothetical protein [Nannocystis punicea]|uniref:Uncharacterized protein n=1 Tax=Nannocystis punicea TaxID=2995304 RepID=A0ABY7GWN5_9BACT|nr:hypothetical protein [Nannocystis poenicansa]WAS91372.1 hypothetical protein O0S08_34730 [Nannocystis poenicansa]